MYVHTVHTAFIYTEMYKHNQQCQITIKHNLRADEIVCFKQGWPLMKRQNEALNNQLLADNITVFTPKDIITYGWRIQTTLIVTPATH